MQTVVSNPNHNGQISSHTKLILSKPKITSTRPFVWLFNLFQRLFLKGFFQIIFLGVSKPVLIGEAVSSDNKQVPSSPMVLNGAFSYPVNTIHTVIKPPAYLRQFEGKAPTGPHPLVGPPYYINPGASSRQGKITQLPFQSLEDHNNEKSLASYSNYHEEEKQQANEGLSRDMIIV